VLLASAAVAAEKPGVCVASLCGKYLPDGMPEHPCKCFGSGLGCCRFEKGCVCEPECAQFGDCCPGMAGLCDRPIALTIEHGEHFAATEPLGPGAPILRKRREELLASGTLGARYTIRGPNLGGTWLQVKLGNAQCTVLEHRSDHIVFALPKGNPGKGRVVVIVDGRSSPALDLPEPEKAEKKKLK
jgi:hypothetical protein